MGMSKEKEVKKEITWLTRGMMQLFTEDTEEVSHLVLYR
jgi:hypothetical protein